MKLKIRYPIIRLEEIELDVNDKLAENLLENASKQEKAEFIFQHLPESERDHVPNGVKGIVNAFDIEYAQIKKSS
ncbi:hypothetical protein EGI16_03540 [Chryseobacterium sp. G0240]|uniref:hypothetical protein n=1 Tax=Chryseobacterium sp. G0240 TaxID=2487066 RepID=UPI000F45BDE7|nr:hypothetical protein [Chryseobacterium sp. G0240]ROI05472.1 hypothetical protein EGI16_03540 [Chryseobacterium sp. G0240]